MAHCRHWKRMYYKMHLFYSRQIGMMLIDRLNIFFIFWTSFNLSSTREKSCPWFRFVGWGGENRFKFWNHTRKSWSHLENDNMLSCSLIWTLGGPWLAIWYKWMTPIYWFLRAELLLNSNKYRLFLTWHVIYSKESHDIVPSYETYSVWQNTLGICVESWKWLNFFFIYSWAVQNFVMSSVSPGTGKSLLQETVNTLVSTDLKTICGSS